MYDAAHLSLVERSRHPCSPPTDALHITRTNCHLVVPSPTH